MKRGLLAALLGAIGCAGHPRDAKGVAHGAPPPRHVFEAIPRLFVDVSDTNFPTFDGDFTRRLAEARSLFSTSASAYAIDTDNGAIFLGRGSSAGAALLGL